MLTTLYKTGEKEETVWEIVGYGETDVPQKQVAYNAPMARILVGLRVGDTVQSQTPKGQAESEVLALYRNWEEVPEQFKTS